MTDLARALAIFSEAIGVDPAARPALLDRACADDLALRRQVEDMLHADAAPGELFAELSRRRERGGEQLGAYRLEALIGSGGMGSVYRARRSDGAYDKPVAIKLLLFDAGDLRQRFVQERRILGNLNHANIASLLDVGSDSNGAPYFVMEYIDGVPITEYAKTNALGVRERIALLLPVLDALQSAHSQLIVHRDIKPGNVLVDALGTPKLLDFGIAKLLGDDAIARTRTGVGPLTPEYASPEQVRGEPVGTPSDIYSLGVLLYELIADDRPYHFGDTSPSAIERTVCETDAPRPTRRMDARRLGGSGRDLDAIVLKALAKSPAQRYASCAGLSLDLRRWLAREAVLARVPSTRERVVRAVRRHRFAVAIAAVATLTLTVGLVAALWQAHIAGLERMRAEARAADLRELSNSLLSEIDQAIKSLPGSTPVQHLLVTRVVEHLDHLARDADGDRAALLDIANGYVQLGDIQGNGYAQNLGDSRGGLANLDKAIALLQPMANDASTTERAALATAWRVHSQVQSDLNPTAAITDIGRAIDLQAPTLGDAAASASALHEAAFNYGLLGDYNGLLPNVDAALAAYRHAVQLEQQALRVAPGNLASTRGAALAMMHMADQESATDVRRALGDVRTAQQLLDALPAAEQTNTKVLETREMLSFRLGDLLDATLDFPGAVAVYAELRRKADDDWRRDPQNQRLQSGYVDARRDAQAYADMADRRLNAAGQPGKDALTRARQLDEEAIAMQRRVLAATPDDPFRAMGLCELQLRLARERHALGLPPGDDARAQDYVPLLEHMAEPADATGDVLNDAATALLDDASGPLRDPARALTYAERAVAKVARQSPDYLYTLARADCATGARDRCVAVAQEALALLPDDRASTRQGKLLLALITPAPTPTVSTPR